MGPGPLNCLQNILDEVKKILWHKLIIFILSWTKNGRRYDCFLESNLIWLDKLCMMPERV